MRLITFDPFRTLGCPGVEYLKPDLLMQHLDRIEAADWLLFPEYTDINLLVHAMGKRIFPSESSYYLGFDKVEMMRAFQARFSAHVPPTLMLPNTPTNREMILDEMLLPFVAKLPRSSRGEGVFLIGSVQDWEDYCARTTLLYVQEYLPVDRDLRIIWIGDRVVHAYWRVAAPDCFHNNIARGASVSAGEIPDNALLLVEKLSRVFNIDHAGFDIAMLGDHPYVFEFNRLFGQEGLKDAGIRPGEIVFDYLQRRLNLLTGGHRLKGRNDDPEVPGERIVS